MFTTMHLGTPFLVSEIKPIYKRHGICKGAEHKIEVWNVGGAGNAKLAGSKKAAG
jgi:hypothetical protein